MTYTTLVGTFKHKVLCILRTSTPGPGQSTCKPQQNLCLISPFSKNFRMGSTTTLPGSHSHAVPREATMRIQLHLTGKEQKKHRLSCNTRKTVKRCMCILECLTHRGHAASSLTAVTWFTIDMDSASGPSPIIGP